MTLARHVVAEFVGGPQDGRRAPISADAPLPAAFRIFKFAITFKPGTKENGFHWPLGGTRATWDQYDRAAEAEPGVALYRYRGQETDRFGAEWIDPKD